MRHTSAVVACVAVAMLASAVMARGDRKVMIWWANPGQTNATLVNQTISVLKKHRNAFTGIAYQYFAVCGKGSDDSGGSQDCATADAVGPPRLKQGHPAGVPLDFGAMLRHELGDELELWPVISYGNPGNASVINAMMSNATNVALFAKDAVAVAHKQRLAGFNIDFETGGMTNLTGFLATFTDVLHSAEPRIGLSYDAGNDPVTSALVDRWISMSTYTSSTPDFLSGLKEGLTKSGTRFGVGLCPACSVLSSKSYDDRFSAIKQAGDKVKELDIWAVSDGTKEDDPGWAPLWPHLATWLAE